MRYQKIIKQDILPGKKTKTKNNYGETGQILLQTYNSFFMPELHWTSHAGYIDNFECFNGYSSNSPDS